MSSSSRTIRPGAGVAAAMVAAVLTLTVAEAGGARLSPAAVRVRLQPGVVRLGQHATITVLGAAASGLQVRLFGATDLSGRSLPWQPLRRVDGRWRASLPAPALRGVYPLQLRSTSRKAPFHATGIFLRVFARATIARPLFITSSAVPRWWIEKVAGEHVVAIKAWRRPSFDLRDRRLHQLFVVAYDPDGHRLTPRSRGMFITAFRNGYHARWRLLEATVAP